MLKMSTDLLKVNRMEKTADSWTLANAVTGSFVTFTATGVGQPAVGDPAVPIFTESNRDGTVGWTGDVGVTGNMTVVYGPLQAITDQFAGTPAVGDKLYVDIAGKLGNAAQQAFTLDAQKVAATVIATCTKAAHNVTYLGRTVSVIEFAIA